MGMGGRCTWSSANRVLLCCRDSCNRDLETKEVTSCDTSSCIPQPSHSLAGQTLLLLQGRRVWPARLSLVGLHVLLNNTYRTHSNFKRRQFKNSDEDERDDVNNSEYTVAIVDNPLYAENEGDIDEFFNTELEGEEEERESEVHM